MKKLFVAVLVVLYLVVWSQQAGKTRWSDYYLSPAPPAPVLKVASGYARQTASFLLFVKVAVFAGGPLRGVDKSSYADSLAQNFEVMTELYPAFIDSYHYCQSFLAPLAAQHTVRANNVLDRGIAELPDVVYLPFFKAFNYYYYLHDYPKSAELFFALSKRPGAPEWFAHLAGTLMARGGNLTAGRAMLQAMVKTEQDEMLKKRYVKSIGHLDMAIRVQEALNSYKQKYGKEAESLQLLVPEFIAAIPNFPDEVKLVWEPPVLRLEQ